MTVVVRDRNVVVTAVLQGNSGRGGYGGGFPGPAPGRGDRRGP